MSSMRNAVARRNHKERAQPFAREKWGVLEKRKDYSLRAKDYNEKKQRLKILRQKAADRNPDEFHFGMMSSSTDRSGRKIADRGNKPLSHDVVKLLKTQDAGYLRTMAQKTRNAKEKARQQYLLGATMPLARHADGGTQIRSTPRHIVFVENMEDQVSLARKMEQESGLRKLWGNDQQNESTTKNSESEGEIDVEEEEDEPAVRPASNDSITRKSTDEAARVDREALLQRRRYERHQEKRATRLQGLERREQDLVTAERELDLQRGKMSHAIGSVTKTGLKFKIKQRKR